MEIDNNVVNTAFSKIETIASNVGLVEYQIKMFRNEMNIVLGMFIVLAILALVSWILAIKKDEDFYMPMIVLGVLSFLCLLIYLIHLPNYLMALEYPVAHTIMKVFK